MPLTKISGVTVAPAAASPGRGRARGHPGRAGEAPALSAASAYTRGSLRTGGRRRGGLSRGPGCRYPIPPSAGGGPIDW